MQEKKERMTINFDADVYQKVLNMRQKPEYVRLSISRIVNMLLTMALNEENGQRDGNEE